MPSAETAVAYHEAAHAVMHVVIHYTLEFVSIEPDEQTRSLGQTKGIILPTSVTTERLATRQPPLNQVETTATLDNVTNLLAGEIAEARLTGRTYRVDVLKPGAHTSDEKWAIGQVQSLYADGRDYSLADSRLDELTARAKALVDENWVYISGVARELIRRRSLAGLDVVALRPRSA